MGNMKILLGVVFLALCFNECLSQAFSSMAKTCSDCNTTNSNCEQRTGYVVCSCKPGFVGNGLNCTRLVFCDSTTCCPQGYTWDSMKKICVDINECSPPNNVLNKCVSSVTCTNKNGIHLCGNSRGLPCPTGGTCSSSDDCLKVGETEKCADPCANYQELNGASRLSTISSTGRFQTDRYNFGWFRYTGSDGLRMQEGCVGPLRCGSLEPFSLNGSHPSIGEGVKMVPLIMNTLAGCTPGASLPVKACPGGYYVYKFSGSLKSEVYCTESSMTTTPTTATTPTTTPTKPTTTTPTTTSTKPTTTTPTTTLTKPTTTTPTTTPTKPTTTTPTSTPTKLTTTTPTTTPTTTTTTTPTTTPTKPTTTTPTTTPTTTTTTTTTTTSTKPTTTTPTTTPTTTTPTTTPTTPTTTPSTNRLTTPTTTPTTPTSTTPTTRPTTPTPTPTKATTTTPTTRPTTPPTTTPTTKPPTTTQTTTPTLPTITTPSPSSTNTPCTNITLSTIIPASHPYPEENITVTLVQSRTILTVRIFTQMIDSKEVKILEINETTIVTIEMKTITNSTIHIRTTTSISPATIQIRVGAGEPESFTNRPNTTVSSNETTAANTNQFQPDSFCSKPAQTKTITETSSAAGNSCSSITSATSTTTTITTTEEVIVLGPEGFSTSCAHH